MKEIKLTRGQFTMVDDEDYDYLMQFKWYAVSSPNGFYAHRGVYNNIKKNNDKIIMARVIMKVTDKNLFVDHINHNTLDNRKENLRICTNKENIRNKKSINGSTSKFLGVHLFKYKHKLKTGEYRYYSRWRATIKPNKIRISLGLFPSTIEGEIQAARAYDKAAKEHYGEFANLNFKH